MSSFVSTYQLKYDYKFENCSNVKNLEMLCRLKNVCDIICFYEIRKICDVQLNSKRDLWGSETVLHFTVQGDDGETVIAIGARNSSYVI